MATVLNRTTKQLIASANTPDYPIAQWIIEPDLSAVSGFSSKYWTITGDSVTLMSTSQRDTVDAADLSAARDAQAAQLDAIESEVRAFALVVLDEINTLRTALSLPTRTIAQLKTAVRNKLGS